MTENNTFYCSFVGNQYIICDCGEAFPSEDDLKEHLENDPDGKHTTTFTEYKCGECFKVYTTEKECIDHQELEHVTHVNEEHSYIKGDFNVKIEIKQEPETVEETVINDCSNSVYYVKKEDGYKEENEIMYYVEQVESDEPETVYEVDESVEESTLIKTTPFKEIKLQPKPRGRRQSVQVTNGEKKKKTYVHKNVVCEVCGKKYASEAALRYHQRVHTGVRPFQCAYCPKNFTMGLFLQIHTRTHTGERPYKCNQCPKAFSNKAALLRHDRVHTGIKPYECPKCGKAFTQSNSMKLHVHTVHHKMPAPYKSARRRAESQARDSRAKRRKDAAGQASEILVEEQLQPKEEQVYSDVPEAEVAEVYYCDLPAREGDGAAITYELLPAGEGGVAYELIYE